MDLRQYSKQVEVELQTVENASIQDCILNKHILKYIVDCSFVTISGCVDWWIGGWVDKWINNR